MNNTGPLYLGIDVGSATVKVVVMEPDTKQITVSKYIRHNAYQAETVRTLLQEVFSQFPDAEFKAAICGSGSRIIAEMLGVPYIQEEVNEVMIKVCG